MPDRSDALLVIIPAWNEEATLAAVIAETRAAVPAADILVVNDCSRDATSRLAHAAGVFVLDLALNLGVGGAMRAGYKYAGRLGYAHTVQLDADGQHDPAEIPHLLAAATAEAADIVIGARFAGKGDYEARGPRYWSMKVLAKVLSRVTRAKLTDTTSGFKLCGARAIALFGVDYPAEYLGDTVEALVIAARAGLKVTQVPVAMRPRAGGTPSHGPLKSALFLARAFFALLIALSRPARRHPVLEAS
ncbi:MAG: glycosyltransferase family 2 protein [Propionibacteriaceae bacterium]|nr:glycosyltransferase family 2 protein [Propionibacteriaceae bacterium]